MSVSNAVSQWVAALKAQADKRMRRISTYVRQPYLWRASIARRAVYFVSVCHPERLLADSNPGTDGVQLATLEWLHMGNSPQPLQTPPEPTNEEVIPRDPHIQSPLDMEVFRFLGLIGVVFAPAAWVFGAFGIDNLLFGIPFGIFILWLLYLVARRTVVLTRDQARAVKAGEGVGVVDATGWNWQWFGGRGTHLGLIVIDGVHYGLALKALRRLRPGMRVSVWYYESSKHIIRIEEIPAK